METTQRRAQADAEPVSYPKWPGMRERDHALRRQNLRSSAAGAVAGAIVVGLLAAIDPAIPFASAGLRAVGAFALGATVGITLSWLSNSLRTIRSREVEFRWRHHPDAPSGPSNAQT